MPPRTTNPIPLAYSPPSTHRLLTVFIACYSTFHLPSLALSLFLVIDTSTYESRPFSPILTSASFDDPSLVLFESCKDETAPFGTEEQTQTYLDELIRKRPRQTSSRLTTHPSSLALGSYCDSDRISLLSVDISASNTNLDLLPTSDCTG